MQDVPKKAGSLCPPVATPHRPLPPVPGYPGEGRGRKVRCPDVGGPDARGPVTHPRPRLQGNPHVSVGSSVSQSVRPANEVHGPGSSPSGTRTHECSGWMTRTHPVSPWVSFRGMGPSSRHHDTVSPRTLDMGLPARRRRVPVSPEGVPFPSRIRPRPHPDPPSPTVTLTRGRPAPRVHTGRATGSVRLVDLTTPSLSRLKGGEPLSGSSHPRHRVHDPVGPRPHHLLDRHTRKRGDVTP